MAQKKVKSKAGRIVATIFHYLLVILAVGIVIAFGVSKLFIDEWWFKFFTDTVNTAGEIIHNWTNITWFDKILYYLPNVGNAVITAGAMFALVALVNLVGQLNIGLTFKGKTLYKVIMSILKWVIIVAGIISILRRT